VLVEPGRRRSEGCGVLHDPGEDESAWRLSDQRLRDREERVDAQLVEHRDENRPLGCLTGGPRDLPRRVQSRILAEDRPLELLQSRAGLDPQLVDERSARVLVGVERLGLATGAVQRRHQVPAQALPERVLGDERLEFADQLAVAP
jgi:hypothetical protein